MYSGIDSKQHPNQIKRKSKRGKKLKKEKKEKKKKSTKKEKVKPKENQKYRDWNEEFQVMLDSRPDYDPGMNILFENLKLYEDAK